MRAHHVALVLLVSLAQTAFSAPAFELSATQASFIHEGKQAPAPLVKDRFGPGIDGIPLWDGNPSAPRDEVRYVCTAVPEGDYTVGIVTMAGEGSYLGFGDVFPQRAQFYLNDTRLVWTAHTIPFRAAASAQPVFYQAEMLTAPVHAKTGDIFRVMVDSALYFFVGPVRLYQGKLDMPTQVIPTSTDLGPTSSLWLFADWTDSKRSGDTVAQTCRFRNPGVLLRTVTVRAEARDWMMRPLLASSPSELSEEKITIAPGDAVMRTFEFKPGATGRARLFVTASSPDVFPPVRLTKFVVDDLTSGPRPTLALNGDWEMCYVPGVDVGKAPPADAKWAAIKVPSEQPASKAHCAWFRRSFDAPAYLAGERIVLQCDEILSTAAVYLNGTFCGECKRGSEPFEIDVTAGFRPAGRNEILIACQDWLAFSPRNRDRVLRGEEPIYKDGMLAPADYDAVENIGIRGPIRLEARPAVAVDDVAIVTSVRQHRLSLVYRLINKSAADQDTILRPRVLDAGAVAMTLPEKTARVPAGGTASVTIETPWPKPREWWPDDPHLYVLATDLQPSSGARDTHLERFGFREFWIDGIKLVLNGMPVKLRSCCVMGAIGRYAAKPFSEPDKRYEAIWNWQETCMRDRGLQLVRTHLWSRFREGVDLADETGMMVKLEGGVHQVSFTLDDTFWRAVVDYETRLVAIYKNHASVMMWSAGNENMWGMMYQGEAARIVGNRWQIKIASAMGDADPMHRPVEWEADGDLMGGGKYYALHYPRELSAFPDLPNAAWWGPLDKKTVIPYSMGPITLGTKPLTVGESFWPLNLAHPYGQSIMMGDDAYLGGEYQWKGWVDSSRLFLDGFRDVEFALTDTYLPRALHAQNAPAAITNRVVFWDDRLDSVGQARHQERLVPWLTANGFTQLRSEALAEWMRARIAAHDADGSVAVMTMGYAPALLAEEPGDGILWIRYLKAGGRIVSLGDLPFNNFEYPDARPLPQAMDQRGYGALGLVGGWNQAYWGRNLDLKPTPQAAEWGFETMDGSITGFAVESVTIPFGTYVVPETGKLGATSWLKNLRPDAPLSGLIKLCQSFDGANDGQIRDVWRAANYLGRPVTVPPLPLAWQPPEAPAVALKLTASGIAGRTEFARGEVVTTLITAAAALNVTSAHLTLDGGKAALFTKELPLTKAADGTSSTSLVFATAPYTYGRYDLKVNVLSDRRLVGEATQTIGIRFVPPEAFNWHVWVGSAPNPYRREMTFADIRAAGMEPHFTDGTVEGFDAILRQNMGASLRLMADLSGGKEYVYEQQPEFFRLDLDRKPIPGAYSGGRPTLGISQPQLLENARRTMREPLKAVASHPALRPYILTNDDFSIYYGWDFSPHVVARFKQATGLDAPLKRENPPHGIVPDDNPWLRWCKFTLRDITGALNRAQTQGITEACPEARVGPIPGGMQIPYIQMWEASQYPPLNFGQHGFNLLSCYYYNMYWQPVMTNTYWMEIGRMANRDLPEWCVPDLFMTAGYLRNNLFHLLAGGVQGLAYFTYDSRNPGTWAEVKRLAPQVRRLSPVQARLRPASTKDIGLLVSLTTNCFDPGHDLTMVYAYENLMQAHFDVEMTCEEELLAGGASRYQAILLYDVRWLRQSVRDALAAHAAKGGLVLLDDTVPFDIPGAKRAHMDTGMGKQHAPGVTPERAPASTPGLGDYGDPDRVAVVQKALAEFVKPRFDCPDIRLVASRFEVGSVPYVWFVNAHTGKEYMYCRERMGAGHPGSGTPDKIAEVIAWEQKEVQAGPYTASATFASLPGVPYDLLTGQRLATRKSPGGQTFDLSMERFGGSLVAFYPEAIERLTLASPAAARPRQELAARLEVRGKQRLIPGAVPVELALLDPSGRPSVLSGVRATDAGILTFRWTPAVNDAKGKWTLTATELASGKTATTAMTVR